MYLPSPGTQCKPSISIDLEYRIIHHNSELQSLDLLLAISYNIEKPQTTRFVGAAYSLGGLRRGTCIAAIDDDGLIGELVVDSC